jgi:hypothetical protein
MIKGDPNRVAGWEFGEFTNEWGDKTGKFFARFDETFHGVVHGTFSNSSTSNAPWAVKNITFSEANGLTFDVYENNIETRVPRVFTELTITMKTNNSEEKTFKGNVSGTSSIMIEFSDELLNILSREEMINFRIKQEIRIRGSSLYQFSFKPDRFKQMYEKLKSM